MQTVPLIIGDSLFPFTTLLASRLLNLNIVPTRIPAGFQGGLLPHRPPLSLVGLVDQALPEVGLYADVDLGEVARWQRAVEAAHTLFSFT